MSRRRALMLRHMAGPEPDRVSRRLARQGYDLDWRCTLDGDPLPAPDPARYSIAVAFGGAQSANDADRLPGIAAEIEWIERWVRRGGTFLGLCLGAQLLARALGAEVAPHPQGRHEIGFVEVEPIAGSEWFLPRPMALFQWHYEGFDLPPGAELLARGAVFPNQAFRWGASAWGLQFHPEVGAVMRRGWIREVGHMLAEPGAHSAERVLADARRHDRPTARWLARFLDRQLA